MHLSISEWAALIQAAGTIFITATFVVYWHQLKAMRAQLEAAKRQMEENRRTNQMAQYQAALQLLFDWRAEMIANPTLAEGFRDSPYFRDAFTILPEQRYFHTVKLFHIFEHFWLLHDRGVIDDQMWQGWARNAAILVQPEATRALWRKLQSAGVFNPGFVQFMDRLVDATDPPETQISQCSA